jgi:predicted transcriptional regulator
VNGVFSYHLKKLERLHFITIAHLDNITRLYPDCIPSEISRAISHIKNSVNKSILKFILNNGPCTLTILSHSIDRSSSTIYWHVGKLIHAQILKMSKQAEQLNKRQSRPKYGSKLYDSTDRDLTDSQYVEVPYLTIYENIRPVKYQCS